ncbi:hypothetical protein N310_01483, partial [Acanthisitta chloris]
LEANFNSIATSHSDLKKLQRGYSQQLDSLQLSLNQTLQRCGSPCDGVSLDSLAFSTNFSMIPSVEQQLEALHNVSDSNITADLE